MTISKPVYDKGPSIGFRKPISPPVHRPESMPTASDCPQSFVVVNDSSDGMPRGRLALSNGASWDALAFSHEIDALRSELRNVSSGTVQIMPPAQPSQPVNVVPMVEAALTRILPQMVTAYLPSPSPVVVNHPRESHASNDARVSDLEARVAQLEEEKRAIAAGLLEFSEHIRELAGRVHYLENNAIAAVQLEERVA